MPRLTPHGGCAAVGTARRRRILLRLAAILLLIAIIPELGAHRILVINTSPSVAPGLYLRSSEEPAVGKLVDFCIPPAARPYIFGRTGESGENWYILKPIIAGPGDHVDTTGEWLIVNGRRMAPMPPPTDSSGRPLPVWRDRRVLRNDEFFVFSNRIPNSFDSRCYGPITRRQIECVRDLLLNW
ncbi:MAG TPA: S26 family signal peptidase [Bryobacteraceae bacterium]|nr:S26 family signal peptidase [Bryobacteraceae bacterium]